MQAVQQEFKTSSVHEQSQHNACLLQSRFHAPNPADAWIMQPTPAAGLEVSPHFTFYVHYFFQVRFLSSLFNFTF